MSRSSHRALAICLAGSALIASCGSATAQSSGQIEVTNSPTTAEPTTTTTTVAGETTQQTYRPPPALPNGSGCQTTQEEGLPAGRWFGYLIEVDAGSFTFDLACEFTNSQALLAAQEDDERLAPGETTYVRNEVADRRVVETNPGISINELDEDGGEDIQTGSFYPQWYVSTPVGIPVWVTMDPSRVRSITFAN